MLRKDLVLACLSHKGTITSQGSSSGLIGSLEIHALNHKENNADEVE